MSAELPFTGERFVPGVHGEIWIEHWHRYHFAARWAAGKRVLDVACGAGYGTALLARVAAQATGVDVASEAIEHAKHAYAQLANAAFVCAPCTKLPLADASLDVVVSFETIEHIAEQEAFLDEVARVLAPGGVLVLSCPNKLEYSDKRDYRNEFHVRELYRDELRRLVAARFPEIAWYGQRPAFYSVIASEAPSHASAPTAGEIFEVAESSAAEALSAISNPLYFVLVASRRRDFLALPAPAVSVLADREDWVHRDYEKVMRYLEGAGGQIERLQGELQARDAAIGKLNAEAVALHDAMHAREAELVVRSLALSERDRTIALGEAEIERRRGWRWWLKLPLIRLGLIKG